jgi:hypothetical protein
MAEIEAAMNDYGRAPLFAYLRDPSVDARDKLGFAPHVAHFAMTFGDLCTLVLRREPACDEYQRYVNAHTVEDEGHWRWYLSDLQLLGEDRELRYTDAIRRIWGEDTVRMRRLSYHLCSFALSGDSLRRLVLVHCIEGAFQVTLGGLLPVARAITERTDKVLSYLGPGHSEVETSHVLEDPALRNKLLAVELAPAVVDELRAVIAEVFVLFRAFTDELLDLSRNAVRDG